MSKYAERTAVSQDRSRAEIERILERYGASSFLHGWTQDQAVIAFEMRGRRVKFLLPMPRADRREFTHTPGGKERAMTAARREWDQEKRRRWRALALVIKAKLEAVEAGISIFEEEFMAYPDSPWLYCHEDGSRVKSLRRSFRSACERAGIKDVQMRDLRRTLASWMVQSGESIQTVSELLRHSDIRITWDTYAHLAPRHVQEAMERSAFGSGSITNPTRQEGNKKGVV